MEFNSKKLEKTSRLLYYSISVVLCLFLILFANKIIDDLDTTTSRPIVENFIDEAAVGGLAEKRAALAGEIEALNNKNSAIEKTAATARENYANEKESFENWVKTRKTLGSPDKDQAVVDRAQKLDEFYKVEQDWRLQYSARQAVVDEKAKQQEQTQKRIDQETERAEQKLQAELKRYDLKVFLIRLLFVGPILALGVFFFIRYRKHKFWPLFFGFTLFSFYAFFFGLVPYLPSYGGYIRYAVGIALSAGLGYYAIKTIRAYIENKQQELQVSSQERAKNVQLEVAEKALDNHYCPSCGKDFFIKKWEFPLKGNENDVFKFVTDFCRHCGLELFSACANCGNKNFSHLPFCSSCGAKPLKA